MFTVESETDMRKRKFPLFTCFFRNSFVNNLMTLSTGTIVAQVLPFFATVIISRLYNPEEMGEWGVFYSYASILAIVGSLRYEGAIVKAKSDSEAYSLTYICVFLSLLFTMFLYLLFILSVLTGFQVGLSFKTLFLLPFYVFTLLLVLIFSNLSTYLRKYRLIASNSVNRSVGQTVSRILLGFLKSNRQGLINGAIIGNVISLATLCHSLHLKKYIRCLNHRRLIQLIKENKDFPKYDLPSNLLNSVSSHCPPILLAYYFVDSVVGLFSMAHTLLYVPMSIIGTSVSQLYYKDASEKFNHGESISELTRKLFVSMFLLGVLFMSIIIVSSDWLFGFVLGSKWNDVGRYLVMLSPWLLLVTAISPLSTIFYVKGKQKVNMNLNFIGMILRVASIVVVASLYHMSDITILSFGWASSLFYIVQGYYILKYGDIIFSMRDFSLLSMAVLFFLLLYFWKIVSYF